MRVQPAALRGGGAGTGAASHALSGRRISDTPGIVTPPPGDAIELDFNTVQTAVTNCPVGGTVLLKSGSVDWGQTLVISKPMTLRGAGRTLTHISDALGKENLIEANTTTAGPIRICHMELIGGIQNRQAAPANTAGVYCIVARGQGKIRVDHMTFTCSTIPASPPVPPQHRAFSTKDGVTGVFDNNLCFSSGGLRAAVNTDHPVWKGVGDHGDNSWAQPVNFGSDDFIYYEDNQWELVAGAPATSAWAHDGHLGGRCVFRYNNMININIAAHGTESGGRGRGIRAMEVYWNTAPDRTEGSSVFCDLRAGQLIIWKNTAGSGYTGLARADQNRSRHRYQWPAADGACGWDLNDTTGGPSGDGIYLQGTCKTGSGVGVLVDTDQNFMLRDWVAGGFSVHNVDQNDGGLIDTQTATQLTFVVLQPGSLNPLPRFDVGDVYQIRKCLLAFDAPGRGSGDYIEGNVNSQPTTPPHWLNQPTDPCYAWDNVIDGEVGMITTPVDAHVVEGRDFFNNTAKPGYTPLIHPHPMRTSGPTADP